MRPLQTAAQRCVFCTFRTNAYKNQIKIIMTQSAHTAFVHRRCQNNTLIFLVADLIIIIKKHDINNKIKQLNMMKHTNTVNTNRDEL